MKGQAKREEIRMIHIATTPTLLAPSGFPTGWVVALPNVANLPLELGPEWRYWPAAET